MKIAEGYDLVSEPSSNTKWCEPRDHMVMQPTIKIKIWSRKTKIGLIGVWHNGTCPKAPTLLGWSRMMPQSQLIFDMSDSVRSRTEECKNHSHTLKQKKIKVIFFNGCQNFGYMSLNSSWKINPNDPLCGLIWGPLKTDPKTLN